MVVRVFVQDAFPGLARRLLVAQLGAGQAQVKESLDGFVATAGYRSFEMLCGLVWMPVAEMLRG